MCEKLYIGKFIHYQSNWTNVNNEIINKNLNKKR